MNGLRKVGICRERMSGTSFGCSKPEADTKKSRVPIGRPGSGLHALTNDKLDLGAYTKEKMLADAKRGAKLAGIVGGMSIIAGLTTMASKEFSQSLSSFGSVAGDICEHVKSGNRNLKQIITESKEYRAVAKIPQPVKAAACVGAAILISALPSVYAARNASNAYLEAKHEIK